MTYQKYMRRLTIRMYTNTFGARRLLMIDYWRAVFFLRPRAKALKFSASAYLIAGHRIHASTVIHPDDTVERILKHDRPTP